MGRSDVFCTTTVVVRLPAFKTWSGPSVISSPGVMVWSSLLSRQPNSHGDHASHGHKAPGIGRVPVGAAQTMAIMGKWVVAGRSYIFYESNLASEPQRLLVLINGGSFSSTIILGSYLETTKRAVFIGEETAGNKIIISGNPIDTILPNTKIAFEVATTKYEIKKGYNLGNGVIPKYHTTFTIDNIIADRDITKDLALCIISKDKN